MLQQHIKRMDNGREGPWVHRGKAEEQREFRRGPEMDQFGKRLMEYSIVCDVPLPRSISQKRPRRTKRLQRFLLPVVNPNLEFGAVFHPLARPGCAEETYPSCCTS